MEAEANPLPSDERTPPVTKMNFVGIALPFEKQGIGFRVKGLEKLSQVASPLYPRP
jgi:hypothetical protein